MLAGCSLVLLTDVYCLPPAARELHAEMSQSVCLLCRAGLRWLCERCMAVGAGLHLQAARGITGPRLHLRGAHVIAAGAVASFRRVLSASAAAPSRHGCTGHLVGVQHLMAAAASPGLSSRLHRGSTPSVLCGQLWLVP